MKILPVESKQFRADEQREMTKLGSRYSNFYESA